MLVFSGLTLAQSPDLKSASGYAKMVSKQSAGWITRAAEKMPEEQYPQSQNISPAFGAETVSPPGPRPGQSPDRKHPRPRTFFLTLATDERELPSRADKRRHRAGRCHPALPA